LTLQHKHDLDEPLRASVRVTAATSFTRSFERQILMSLAVNALASRDAGNNSRIVLPEPSRDLRDNQGIIRE